MDAKNTQDMLDSMNKEQEELSLVLMKKETEQESWEERVVKDKKELDGLEVTLNRLKKEEMLVDEEIRLGHKTFKKFSNMIEEKSVDLELLSRNSEKLKILKMAVEEENSAMSEQCENLRQVEKEAEKETEMGREIEAVKKTKLEVDDRMTMMVAEHGTVTEVTAKIVSLRDQGTALAEELEQIDEECLLQHQVIGERRSIVTKMEIEARMAENKMQAQVRRLRRTRDTLMAIKKEKEVTE